MDKVQKPSNSDYGHVLAAYTEGNLWKDMKLHAIIKDHKVKIQRQQKSNYVGFEALTAVTMKCTLFWNVTQCSPTEVH
jgi:hypothetical protein